MTERVEPTDIGVAWEPNAPMAVMATNDDGLTALALHAHPADSDRRSVVLLWRGTRSATMADPNDEAISGHRLYEKGLREVLWVGTVENSALVDALERQNRVHPLHDAAAFRSLVHQVVVLKECVVEVVARSLSVQRSSAQPAEAAFAALAS